jgi:hypothetical protein
MLYENQRSITSYETEISVGNVVHNKSIIVTFSKGVCRFYEAGLQALL